MDRDRHDLRPDLGRDQWLALGIAALWTVLLIVWRWPGFHPDLNALWFAGHFFGAGRPDLVYVADPASFPDTVHPDWLSLSATLGCEPFCAYPFVYPPLWAVLSAWVADPLGLAAFNRAALIVMAVLFAVTPILAWRLMRPRLSLPLWTFLCLGLATLCNPGLVALVNLQPQLLVTFLVLLAFERAAAGRPWLGGALLGLAAAIKLYPALFGLLFVLARNRRAALATALSGLALLALSLVLAGPDLHREFLAEVRTLGGLILPVGRNYSLPALFAWADPAGWQAVRAGLPAPPVIMAGRLAGPVILALGLALLVLRARREGPDWTLRAALAPLVALVGLASPVGWPYYFIIPLWALLTLPERLGRTGLRIAVVAILPVFVPLLVLTGAERLLGQSALALGGAAFALIAFAALALAPYRGLASTS